VELQARGFGVVSGDSAFAPDHVSTTRRAGRRGYVVLVTRCTPRRSGEYLSAETVGVIGHDTPTFHGFNSGVVRDTSSYIRGGIPTNRFLTDWRHRSTLRRADLVRAHPTGFRNRDL